MNKVRVERDFGLLDKGVGEENPFVLVTGIEVNSEGSVVDVDMVHKVLSNEAVRKGATRVNGSDCVDIGNHFEVADDTFIGYNGGDVYYPYNVETIREKVKAKYSGSDLEGMLQYIAHREARYHFLLKEGVITVLDNKDVLPTPSRKPIEKGRIKPSSFTDELLDFIGL